MLFSAKKEMEFNYIDTLRRRNKFGKSRERICPSLNKGRKIRQLVIQCF